MPKLRKRWAKVCEMSEPAEEAWYHLAWRWQFNATRTKALHRLKHDGRWTKYYTLMKPALQLYRERCEPSQPAAGTGAAAAGIASGPGPGDVASTAQSTQGAVLGHHAGLTHGPGYHGAPLATYIHGALHATRVSGAHLPVCPAALSPPPRPPTPPSPHPTPPSPPTAG